MTISNCKVARTGIMDWVKRKLLCQYDAEKSDYMIDNNYCELEGSDEFSKDEIKRICSWFHLNSYDEIERLTPYHFKNRWERVLSKNLSITWLEFLFCDGPDEKCDQLWERLYWLVLKQWKGNCYDRASAMFVVLGCDEDTVECQQVIKYVDDIMDSLQLIMEFSENSDFKKWIKCSLSYETNFLGSLTCYVQRDLLGKHTMDLDEIVKWLAKVSVLRDVLGEICSLCVNLKPPPRQLLPSPMCNVSWNSFINIGQIIFLASQLDQDDTVEWRLLYNRNIHGGDLNTFEKCVRDKGPSLLLIKDENKHIFGAFVSQPWTTGNGFYGDDKCFLFTLAPEMNVYRTCEMNSSFIFFCNNKASEKCGVGLGGSLGTFSIWLEESLDKGTCSDKCSTLINYSMPTVAPGFMISELQVWATRDKCDCMQDSLTSIGNKTSLDFD